MLKRCIVAENRKLHASPIWAMFVVLPLISAGYGTFNYLQNLEILTERWYSLWTQHTLFYSMLFFPAMVSAYAAYLWRLEHMGHNWNLIMAVPVRPFDLFLAKFLVVVKLMCFTQVFVYILYLVCGRLFAGFTDWPPVSTSFFMLRGVLGGLAVAAAKSTPRAAFSSHMGAAQPVMRPIWPQRPEVPMPELMAAPFIWSLNRQVASGGTGRLFLTS